MANKRMFSIDVVDTDKFLDMPVSTQALYFHFGMRADDDGFVSSPKKIVKIANCTNDDLRVLISKGYIIPFESGVVVITDWRKNNTLKGDRYKPTVYQEELGILETQGNSYILKGSGISSGTRLEPDWNQIGTKLEPQYSIDKYSIDKSSIDKEIYVQPEVATPPELTPKKKTSRFLPPTEEEVKQYCLENGYTLDAQRFVDFYECKIKRARGEEDQTKVFHECDVLVLDDIGAQSGGEWQRQEIFRLVNDRMETGKITIYTSNMSTDSLNVDSRTRDRIVKASVELQMPEESLRRKKAEMEQQQFLREVL